MTEPTGRFLLALALTALACTVPASPQVNILCLGDSITQGGRNDRDEFTYRLPLQRLLLEAGVGCDFIGSRTAGLHADAIWPEVAPGLPFDPDHEGYYGHKTADAVSKMIDAWTPAGPAPDIVLIHLGTNDQKNPPYDQTVKAPLAEAIAFLREQDPNVAILLGQLNFNDSPGAFRIMAEICELKKELNTQESPIVIVHHYRDWHEDPEDPDSDTFDWAHPNPQGQEKMAARWFEAMRPFLHLGNFSRPLQQFDLKKP